MAQTQREFAEEVAEHYSQELYKFLLWKLRDPTESREVVQATFVRLLESERIPVNDIANARAFVFRIAMNIAIDRQRREKLASATFVEMEREEQHLQEETPSTEKVAIDKERMERFVSALKELPERPRTAFMMQRFDGASYDDIAQTFSVSNSMVKKYLRRALAHLHKRLPERA